MKQLKRIQILDSTALKIIAMISMVLDHVGDNFFPDQTWMRILGRIALPIFAFCICEGYTHTRDKVKYLKRMLLFGAVSEIPFDLVTSDKVLEFSHQNIMLTFSWALIALMLFDRVTEKKKKSSFLIGAGVLLLFMICSIILMLDYSFLALALIFVCYLLRNRELWIRNTAASAVHALFRNVGIYWFGLLGFLPIFLYNGKRGRGYKWLFYIFYPGHLLLIWLIRSFMM